MTPPTAPDSAQAFSTLSPDQVLSDVEALGLRCTGSCFALNSYENRVYEIELEEDASTETLHPIHRRRVVKFYRPARWSREQILEEHAFLSDLASAEVPVVNTLSSANGHTLHTSETTGLMYTLFPKVGGRIPQEPTDEQLLQIGRLIARMHNVGAEKEANHRLRLTAKTYGMDNLQFLLENGWVPVNLQERYETAARRICTHAEAALSGLPQMRLHGDCHLANLLENKDQIFFLDFDDMVVGPAVQDLWLIMSHSQLSTQASWELLLEGYEHMRPFDRKSLKAVEPLRSLRMIHYTAWLARRWKDPSFPKAFPFFNTEQYWTDQVIDLEDQLELIEKPQDIW